MTRTRGHVALVGAGPGDPEMITVRGLRELKRADVVLHDRLSSPELLDEVTAGTRIIDVGKHVGRPTPSQPWINGLIIEHASRGLRVVRLKGGDGYVFGRGAEEAEAVIKAGIPLLTVPGVSSGIAVPAAAGVPVTHRGVSRAVAFVTAVTDWDYPTMSNPLDTVAHVDTICIFMGRAVLADSLTRLMELGRAPDTPVMSISNGCTPRQRHVAAPLGIHAAAVVEAELPSPLLTVVGHVVDLHPLLTVSQVARAGT